jgi:hypothetical protein
MALSSPAYVPFQILDILLGPPNKLFYYRIVAGSSVRYLAAPQPLSSLPDTIGKSLEFDAVPLGDWNIATLVLSPAGKFALASTEKQSLPDVTPTWHVSNIDFLELGFADKDDDDHLQLRGHIPSGIAASPRGIGATQVAAVWSLSLKREDHHGLTAESYVYSLLQGTSISPRFLAHLTECDGRVIGHILEAVLGRPAHLSDLDTCREVLQKLHSLGIAYGNLTPDAFLIPYNTSVARLQFFYSSYQNTDSAILDNEMLALEKILL